MTHRTRDIVNTVVFSLIIAVFAVWCIVIAFNPAEESLVEKRPLAQLPTDFTIEQLLNNKTEVDSAGNEILPPIKQFENFAVDQFPLRQFFRTIKAHFTINILGLKDNNGYAVENGSISQITPEFSEPIMDYQIGRLEYTYDKYIAGNGGNHYLAIVPDKNYFFGKDYGYITPDYEHMIDKVTGALPEMEYIDIFGSLTLEDYYKTDWHWDQSKLEGVIAALGDKLGFSDRLSGTYEEHKKPFNGGYTDQSALYPPAESLTYLTNSVLDKVTVYNYATQKNEWVYSEEMYNSETQYDFFLSGMAPLQRIDNPAESAEGTIIIFRDSFGSAIVPLIAEAYETTYVVDIRYIAPMMAFQQIGDITDMDVLYLYSTTVINTHCFSQLP